MKKYWNKKMQGKELLQVVLHINSRSRAVKSIVGIVKDCKMLCLYSNLIWSYVWCCSRKHLQISWDCSTFILRFKKLKSTYAYVSNDDDQDIIRRQFKSQDLSAKNRLTNTLYRKNPIQVLKDWIKHFVKFDLIAISLKQMTFPHSFECSIWNII